MAKNDRERMDMEETLTQRNDGYGRQRQLDESNRDPRKSGVQEQRDPSNDRAHGIQEVRDPSANGGRQLERDPKLQVRGGQADGDPAVLCSGQNAWSTW
ncbi:hypothetical protein [Neobacillus sp. Marseille-QA0830]